MTYIRITCPTLSRYIIYVINVTLRRLRKLAMELLQGEKEVDKKKRPTRLTLINDRLGL